MSGFASHQFSEVPLITVAVGTSGDSTIALKQYPQFRRHFNSPISRQNNLTHEFYNLVAQWRKEVQYSSSIMEICMNPSYQKIIGMGEKIVPLILQELDIRPDHWFWALKAITGADPIQPHQRGKINEMAKAWVNWARENNYKW